MKVLIINTTDVIGGAANLAWQLGDKLQKEGLDVKYLVGYKYTNSPNVDVISKNLASEFVRNLLGNNILRYLRHLRAFIFANDVDFGASAEILNHPWFKEADVIHLHNLHGHYFKLSTLIEISKRKPVVWTLHDMWSFTSHCGFCFECKDFNKGKHFTREFFHYQPMLWNNSEYLWKKKSDIYKKSNLQIVSPSLWLKKVAESTHIFNGKNISLIRNGVDTNIYKLMDKKVARKKMSLPLEKKIILGVYSGDKHDKRKRFSIFREVADKFKDNKDILFMCLGLTNKEYIQDNIVFYPYVKFSKNTLCSVLVM